MSLNADTKFQVRGFVVSAGRCHNDAASLLETAGLEMKQTAETVGEAEIHGLRLRNTGRLPVMVERAGLRVVAPVGEGDWRVFLDSGSLSWAGVRPLNAPDPSGSGFSATGSPWAVGECGAAAGHRSSLMTALVDLEGGPVFLAGFLGQKRGMNFVDVWPDRTGRCVVALEAWGEFAPRPFGGRPVPCPLEMAPGAELELDPLYLRRGGADPQGLMEEFGRQVQRRHGRTFDEPPIVGLMTWYGQYADVDEDLAAGNLPILADLFNGYPQPMRHVLIVDHGWQQDATLGTTQADRRRFSHGLAWLSAEARKHGIEVGLWHSVTNVTADAENIAELEPMLARDAAGKPVVGGVNLWASSRPGFVPDAARPDVRQWWRRQLRELSGLGVRYFKLDFFAPRVSEPVRAKHPTGDLIDAAYEAFREACPPGTHLAPCSCDTNLQLGRCDSVRIGADIGEAGSWPAGMSHYRSGLASIAAMWFKQRHFWVNDPDSAQVGRGCSLGEARVRATAAAFSGGHFMLGEDLRTVAPERLEIIRRLLPVYPVAARPLDLFSAATPEGYPAVWALPIRAAGVERIALALFNLDPRVRRFELTASMLGLDAATPFAAWEWWQNRYLGVHTGRLEVEVGSGDVAVIHAGPVADHPSVLSVSHHHTPWHIVPECRWDAESRVVRGVLLTKPGLKITLYGHAPRPWRLTVRGRFDGAVGGDGNWQYTVRPNGPRTSFEVPFER
jgi:hypothetical protein